MEKETRNVSCTDRVQVVIQSQLHLLDAGARPRVRRFSEQVLARGDWEKPSFVSRVTNAEVLRRSGHLAATQLLQKRQLQLLGKVLEH